MKKRLLPILFASVMMLAACNPSSGPAQPEKTVDSLNITNKTELEADWYAGDEERVVEVTASPALEYDKEWKKSGHLLLVIGDKNVINYQGFGNVIEPKAAGTTTVSVSYYGKVYDSVTITVTANRTEPATKADLTLKAIYDETTGKSSGLADPTQKYSGTYTIETIEYNKKGYMTIKDSSVTEGYQLYESSKNMVFEWVAPGKYTYANSTDFREDAELMNLEPGDTVTGEFIAFCYGGKTSGFELIGKITSVAKATRPAATTIAIQNKDKIEAYEMESGVLEAVVGPDGASVLVDWSVVAGTGDAVIDFKGNISYTKAGTITVKVSPRGVATVVDSVEITVGALRDKGFVGTPVAGQSYKLSFLRGDPQEHYYFNGKQSTYYGDSTKKYEEAVDVKVEDAGNGKFDLSYTDPTDSKKYYIGIREADTHINILVGDQGKDGVDNTKPSEYTHCTWNEQRHTFVFSSVPKGETSEVEYVLCNDTTNKATLRAYYASDAFGGTQYSLVHLHSEEPEPVEPVEIEEITVARSLEIISELADNGVTSKQYAVIGFITWKQDKEGNTYKTLSFRIGDNADDGDDVTKTLYFYSTLKREVYDDYPVGQKVKIVTTLKKYVKGSTTTPQGGTVESIEKVTEAA